MTRGRHTRCDRCAWHGMVTSSSFGVKEPDECKDCGGSGVLWLYRAVHSQNGPADRFSARFYPKWPRNRRGPRDERLAGHQHRADGSRHQGRNVRPYGSARQHQRAAGNRLLGKWRKRRNGLDQPARPSADAVLERIHALDAPARAIGGRPVTRPTNCVTCPECDGAGIVNVIWRGLPESVADVAECSACRGIGEISRDMPGGWKLDTPCVRRASRAAYLSERNPPGWASASANWRAGNGGGSPHDPPPVRPPRSHHRRCAHRQLRRRATSDPARWARVVF